MPWGAAGLAWIPIDGLHESHGSSIYGSPVTSHGNPMEIYGTLVGLCFSYGQPMGAPWNLYGYFTRRLWNSDGDCVALPWIFVRLPWKFHGAFMGLRPRFDTTAMILRAPVGLSRDFHRCSMGPLSP